MTILNVAEMQKLQISPKEIESLSIYNTQRLLGEVTVEPHDQIFLLCSDNPVYLASTLFLDGVWNFVASLVDGDIIAAAPARDTVIFTGLKNAEGLRLLREQAKYVFENGDHIISPDLLQRTTEGWKTFV